MLSVVIQAGGESRRMGRDKGLAPFLGEPLILRALKRVAPIADELLVTTNNPDAYRFLGVALYPDIYPGLGALGGLFTAISSARGDLVAVVACDMPFISLPILSLAYERLSRNNADVAIPKTSQGYEPFHAIYRKSTCLLPIKRALEAGERRLISWFPSVTITVLDEQDLRQLDPLGLAFQNINTPEELRQAEALAREVERLSA